MNIAMTGATGFIGEALMTDLRKRQHNVYPVPRGITALALAKMLGEQKTDVVVHLASLFIAEHTTDQITALIESNVLFGTEVLEAMKLANVRRIVNAGTSWQNFHTSHDQYRPVCLYAATKQAFEDILGFYVDAYKMKAITLKIFDTYGPTDRRPKLVPKLFEAAKNNTRIELSPGDQEIDLLYVDDLCAAFVTAIDLTETSEPGTRGFGLSSGQRTSLKNLVAMIGTVTGKKMDVHFGARPYREREVMNPTSDYPALPSWSPKTTLAAGLERVWRANV